MDTFNTFLSLSELKEHYSNTPVGICPLYKGSIGTTKRFETSGNPVVIPEYVALEKLNVEFLPKQAGTGDPSPENVRPITGWDNVRVHQRGLNLLDFSKIAFSQGDIGNGMVSVDYVQQTITIAANINNIGYYQTLRDIVGEDLPPGTYVLDAETSSANAQRLIYILDTMRAINFGVPTLFSDADLNSTFSWYNGANNPEPNTISNIRFCMAPTPYEPYQPGTTAQLSFPETIYGGTVDAVTGVGSKTWGYIASYNGESLPGEWISDRDVYAPGITPTTGAQVAYKLATPEPFKVSQISIPSLGSENTFFTNGDNMDIIYKEALFGVMKLE